MAAYRNAVDADPRGASSATLLAALASESREMRMALERHGADLVALSRMEIHRGGRRWRLNVGSRELARTLVRAGVRAEDEGRDVITHVDFVRALASRLAADEELRPFRLTPAALRDIAEEISPPR